MSKRLLPGPHADRSAGVDFSMSSTPNDTPQRATAAQMASRKIKELNKRRTKPSAPSGPSTPFSFGESTPGIAAPATNSATSNGFSFGQSQSFPAAAPSSAAPNGSQSISFGAGSSSNFNFGGFNSSNNPFANLNGGSAPAQPPSQTSNIFGAQTSTQPQSQGLFSQTSTASPAPGTVFQSQPAGTGSNLFGQSTAAAPASGSGTTNLFGQSTPASTGAPNLFGQSTSVAPTSQPAAATTAPGSIFGQSASAAPASSLFQPKPATSSPSLFGQNPPATTTGGANLFGQSTTATTSGPSLFQPKPATSGTPILFGQSTPSTTATGGASLFGKPAAEKTEGAPLFTPSTPNKPSGSAAPSNIFSFGQPAASTPAKPLFGVTNDVDDMSTSPDGKQKAPEQVSTAPSIFGQKAAPTSAPTTSLFAPSTSTTTAAANPPAASTLGSSNNIFGQQQSRSATPNGVSAEASSVFSPTAASATSSNPFQSLFTGTSKPATTTTPATSAPAPAATSGPFQSLFAGAPKPATTAPAAPAAAPASASTTTSTTSQPLFAGISKPAQTQTSFTPQPQAQPQQTPSKRLGAAIMDQASAAASGTAADSIDFDLRSQIRDLNRGFKAHLASFDPETQSLDAVILHYVRLRKTVGAPVGSLTNKPGKRKLDDTHGIESPVQRSVAKKSKAQESSEAALPEPEFPSYSARPSTAGKRKTSEDDEDHSFNKRRTQPGAAGSETSSLFASSFSSGSKDKVTADAAPAFKPSTSTSNGSSLFGFKPSAPSEPEAPRPASPEKKVPEPAATKPAFEVPKFGNAGHNFAGQFGQGSFKKSSAEAPKVNLAVPKFGASGQNFMSQFVQQAKGDDSDDDSTDSDEEPQPVKPVEKAAPAISEPKTAFSSSIFDSKPDTPPVAANNIFGHLTNSNTNSDAAESSDDDITGALKKRAKKAQPASEESEAKSASSLFGRITRPDGTPIHVSSDEDKPETPQPKPLFGQGTPSFLAAPNNTPSLFSSTSASKTSNIFGASQPSTPNPFSSINPNPAAHLLGSQTGTATASVTSDSNAEETDTESYKDTQLNLMSNAGEEDEECLYECRSRAMKLTEKPSEGGKTEKAWEVQGVGQLRLLLNKEKQRARFVLRAEPSGRAVLNTSINRAIDYKVAPGSCQFLVPRADGSGMDFWALKFKKEITAEVESALKSAKDSLAVN